MIWINQLRLALAQPRVAQPHRYASLGVDLRRYRRMV
jgi:hypothetical protein